MPPLSDNFVGRVAGLATPQPGRRSAIIGAMFYGSRMHTLISELQRLYLREGQEPGPAALRLVGDDGQLRTLVLAFGGKGGGAQHWSELVTLANALQQELDLPAPAVSVSGGDTFHLWLSLATPVPLAQAQAFVALLRRVFLPDSGRVLASAPPADLVDLPLPPHLHASGNWSAFIHPGMGAAFVDEPGLDMAPPAAGQLALLENVRSITAAQFAQALAKLQQHVGEVAAPAIPASPALAPETPPSGLLLQDATLEDIVRWLHARNIEPTFRHGLP